MGGVYSRNRLFDSVYLAGKENLPNLEGDVCADETVVSSVLEDYETSIEEDWSDFVKIFYE
jgi:hypothetical protein